MAAVSAGHSGEKACLFHPESRHPDSYCHTGAVFCERRFW